MSPPQGLFYLTSAWPGCLGSCLLACPVRGSLLCEGNHSEKQSRSFLMGSKILCCPGSCFVHPLEPWSPLGTREPSPKAVGHRHTTRRPPSVVPVPVLGQNESSPPSPWQICQDHSQAEDRALGTTVFSFRALRHHRLWPTCRPYCSHQAVGPKPKQRPNQRGPSSLLLPQLLEAGPTVPPGAPRAWPCHSLPCHS